MLTFKVLGKCFCEVAYGGLVEDDDMNPPTLLTHVILQDLQDGRDASTLPVPSNTS